MQSCLQRSRMFGRVSAAFLVTFTLCCWLAPCVQAADDWTFMVYLDGDNNLEEAGIDDFLEMASVGSDANVKIVVMFDRISGYDTSYDNWTGTRRGVINAGDTPTASWGTDLGEQNMADGATLTSFIDWATSTYPASNYALVLWNHGGGWRQQQLKLTGELQRTNDPEERDRLKAEIQELQATSRNEKEEKASLKAVCWDDTDGGCLYTKEVRQALDNATEDVDLIGFDACLMGMIEVGYELRNSGPSVMVGSEETEPANGWPYDTLLADLVATPTATPAQLGQYIVDRYYASYGNSQTQSAVDLTEFDNLATAVDSLADVLIASWNTDEDAVKTAAQSLVDALDVAVVHNQNGPSYPGADGIAINFPTSGADGTYTGSNIDFAADTSWPSFLDTYASSMGGSWVAESREGSQTFFEPQYVDLRDFAGKLVNYGNNRAYVETLESNDFHNLGSGQGWEADDNSWSYSLPFTFPFYGTDYSTVNVCSNGFLDFTSSATNFSNSNSGLIGNTRIAPLWDDLQTNGTTACDIFIYQPTASSVSIRWKATEYDDGGSVNVEVVLHDDGRIMFNYGSGNATLTPTVGISNGDGDYYDLSTHNGASNLANVQSILFTPDLALHYSTDVFLESVADDGSMGNSIDITLHPVWDSFTGANGDDLYADGKVIVANVPVGLTAEILRNNANSLTVSLLGNAANHDALDGVADMTLDFQDNAFTEHPAADVLDSARSDLIVDFDPSTHLVSFQTDGTSGATISGTILQSVTDGSDCTAVEAQAPTGYAFLEWTGTGGFTTTSTNPLTVTNVASDMTITAHFIEQHTVTFQTDGTVGATINGSTTQTVNDGSNCTSVTAVPASGYRFVEWTGTGGFATTSANPLTVTNVTGDMTITANFAELHVVTFETDGTAGASLTGETSQSVMDGQACTAVTAEVPAGYTFTGWTGTGGFTSSENPLTLTNVTNDMTVTANYVASAPAGGSSGGSSGGCGIGPTGSIGNMLFVLLTLFGLLVRRRTLSQLQRS